MAGKNNILIITLLLAASFVLGSCRKTPVPYSEDYWAELCGDKLLRFSSVLTETKASSELVDGSTFGVFAFFQEGDVENETTAHWADGAGNGANWTPEFMFNQQVDKQSGDYTYSPLRYWPSNAENTVSFWAYAPYNTSVTFYQAGSTTNTYTSSSHGLPDVKFSVTDGKTDFITSNLVTDKTYWNCTPNRGIVDFEFKHRLAWVEFKAKTAYDYVSTTFTVTKIEIINACNDAVYHPNTNTWTNRELVTGVGRQAVAFSGSQEIVFNEARSCSSNPMLMIPQDIVRDAASETGTVKARITFTQSEGGQNVSKTVEASLNVSSIDEWEANHKYTYTFSISASDAIQLSIQVEKWEYWLGTSEYKENVTITKQLTWDPDTYVNGGSNCTRIEAHQLAGDAAARDYKILVLKPGVNLSGKFIFDTPYNGTWYAMLEPVLGSQDGSIVFSNDTGMQDGIVGNEAEIIIKPASESISATQYAVLRFMCRTHPVDEAHPESAQTIPVQDVLIGGPFIIQQNIN